MPRKSLRASVPTAGMAAAMKHAGANLRLARLRRRMTLAEVAERLGIDRRTVSAMEAGAPQVALSVMAGALWVYGLERDFTALADPDRDALGRGLEARRRPRIARRTALDDDF